jgi:hypothetical protein
MAEINGYNLSKAWFEFAWENNSKVKPTHTALFFWCVELWNRLGQPKEFGLPSSEARTAMSISRSDVFTGCLSDLKEWGFIEIVHQSINQHKANIIKICPIQIVEGNDQALRRATSKQRVSNVESNVDVNKPKNIEPINKEIDTNVSEKNHRLKASPFFVWDNFLKEWNRLGEIKVNDKLVLVPENIISRFYDRAVSYTESDATARYANWVIAARNWCKTAYEEGKIKLPQDVKSTILPEIFNDIKSLKSAAVGETHNWAKRVAKNNEEHTAMLVNMLEKEGVVLIDGKFTHNG